jgi:hypothetical protein
MGLRRGRRRSWKSTLEDVLAMRRALLVLVALSIAGASCGNEQATRPHTDTTLRPSLNGNVRLSLAGMPTPGEPIRILIDMAEEPPYYWSGGLRIQRQAGQNWVDAWLFDERINNDAPTVTARAASEVGPPTSVFSTMLAGTGSGYQTIELPELQPGKYRIIKRFSNERSSEVAAVEFLISAAR